MSSTSNLFHLSINPTRSPTIVFLHGLFSNHLEWEHVTPFLSDRHLLVVDLPAHTQSLHVRPFDLASAAEKVADLIKAEAHNGRAHVVGLSAGGFVGLELAKRYPNLVDSLCVTGAAPWVGWRKWFAARPTILYYFVGSLTKYCPDWLYWKSCSWIGITRHDDLRAQMKKNLTMDLVVQGYGSILDFRETDVSLITSRTLTLAGSKQDDVEATREMGKILRQKCAQSKAALVTDAIHAWNLQFPELFAKIIKAWIDETEWPEAVKELE